ncbi:MAG: hypothetical protein JST78_06270 [Bacteroidetes bacterium]|nr:hypothetical protein [Bacteroidota bacterium]
MEIRPKFGIGPLLFGMKQKDVQAVLGKPDKQFEDDDQNIIYIYNSPKLRLTFYEDEDFRMGYIISSHPDLVLYQQPVIGKTVEEIKKMLQSKQYKNWEQEDFDLAENHFNEDHWLILQSEYNEIVKVELGVVAKNADDFDWKF